MRIRVPVIRKILSAVILLCVVIAMPGLVARPVQAEGLFDPMPRWALAGAFGTPRLYLMALLADRPQGAVQAARDVATSLGLGPDVRFGLPEVSFSLRPLMVHDPNINGGLPFDRIEIGALTFTVTEETRARAAWTFGARASANLDMPLTHGLIGQLHAQVGRRHAPRHDANITDRGAGLCLRYTAESWLFLDGCLSGSDLENARSQTASRVQTVTLGRVFDTARAVHELSLTRMQIDSDKQRQNRLRLSYRSMIAGVGAVDVGLTLGGRIDGRLMPTLIADLGYGALVMGQPTRISASYTQEEGGRLFGQDRRETSWTLRASRAITGKAMVYVSHTRTTSTIPAFDNQSWGFGLEFTGFRW